MSKNPPHPNESNLRVADQDESEPCVQLPRAMEQPTAEAAIISQGVSESMEPSNARTVVANEDPVSNDDARPRLRIRHESDMVLLGAKGVRKSYRKGQVSVPVLNNVDIDIHPQEFLSIVGKSGSGKSTLMHLLATLDAPDSGQIQFDGERIDNLSSARRDRLRNTRFGIVFQFYHLLPELTTIENVLLPSMIENSTWSFWAQRKSLRARAMELLERVGLEHRLKHRPAELSGGEMQRVAIARALMNQPEVLLADEPTGNLDRQTGGQIMDLMRSLNDEHKLTIVMVTHDSALADQTDRVVELVEGRVCQA